MPTSSSASPSPPSASHSQNSATQPQPQPQPSLPPPPRIQHKQTDAETINNGLVNLDDKKPDFSDHFQDFDDANSIEKFKKYDADYTQRLMAKYFSRKNLYGGDIFDENTTIDDEIIKSSKWPCSRSFADPLQGFEDHSSSCSTSTLDNQSSISNGKHPLKKNG